MPVREISVHAIVGRSLMALSQQHINLGTVQCQTDRVPENSKNPRNSAYENV